MKDYCENPLCQNRAIKDLPVSVRTPGDQTRSLCATCEESFSWGVQHGKMIIHPVMFWIVVAADSGLIAHVRAYSSKAEAEAGLIEYLRTDQFYTGADNLDAACQWIKDHEDRLSVEIIEQNMDIKSDET